MAVHTCGAGLFAGAAFRLLTLFTPVTRFCGLLAAEGATARVGDDAWVGGSAEFQQQSLAWRQLAAQSLSVDVDELMVAWHAVGHYGTRVSTGRCSRDDEVLLPAPPARLMALPARHRLLHQCWPGGFASPWR